MQVNKKNVLNIIQIGNKSTTLSKWFDYFITTVIFINIFAVIFETFDEAEPYMLVLKIIETITVVVFVIEYILRLWTADVLYPKMTKWQARKKFALSFFGLIDLLTFLPYFLPMFSATGVVVFKMFR